jgi:nucleotide-binding universal stress UspA family protein
MPIKVILVPMNAVQSDLATLDLALAVARPARPHIDALFVRPDPRDVALYTGFGAEGLGSGTIMAQIEKEGAALAVRARKAFAAWCARNDVSEVDTVRASERVSASWHEVVGAADQVIADRGALSDLIVETGLHDPTLPFEQTTIEASLFGAGRAVLVAPRAPTQHLDDTALIAWNGSREANRAVGAALELLGRSKKVLIFCEPEGKGPHADPAELIAFLGWHGVTAQHVPGTTGGKSIGASLLDTATREHASLLIMGAYTRGRFRELVLGGVTDHVLHHAAIPVLLMH